MVGGSVGVFEGNTVEGNGVLAVLETAEVGFALPEADPVWVEAECARRIIYYLGEVGDRINKILDEDRADHCYGGNGVESIAGGRGVGREGNRLLNGDRLRNGIDIEGNRKIRGSLDTEAGIQSKTRRGGFDGEGAGGESG